MGKIARAIGPKGKPLMPWQQYVADVAGEYDPVTGIPFYRTVIISTPRQQGKSILVLAKKLDRCTLWDEPQVCVYTAQTGFEAGKKLIKSWYPDLKRSKLRPTLAPGPHLGLRKAAGNQGIDFVNGSRIDIQASGDSSGHGDTVDDGTIDEAWHDADYRREQSLRPAMLTRDAAQLWIVSTAGTDASIYWNERQDMGRAAAHADTGAEVCYFEWCCPEDVDPLDPAGWPLYMPALGHSITAQTVKSDIAALNMSPTEIARAYGNRRQSTSERLIPAATWDLVNDPSHSPTGQPVFGLDANPERSAAAVVACGGGSLEVVAHLPRLGWVIPRVKEKPELRAGPWAVDPAGPAAPLIPDLKAEGVEVIEVGGRELAAACGSFYDAVIERAVKVRRSQSLDDAVAGARKRASGDAWTWARRSSDVDISPLVAATLALWVASRTPTTVGYYGGGE